MRIAVDAMGGDFAPREVVRGAAIAAERDSRLNALLLVGDENAIRRELAELGRVSPKLQILHASESVGMEESPAMAVRKKKGSSISRAVELLRAGEADAMVSAGNTGAVMVAATLKLRPLAGVERPAVAAVMPSLQRPFVLVDAGANVDCSAGLLYQFAVMGTAYSSAVLGVESPVVGLLSVGREEEKGNETTREAFKLLKGSRLNFCGNVEGHDLFRGGTDVVVCDGFVGNVVLKTSESAGQAIAQWMRQEFTKNVIRRLGTLLLFGALRSLKKRLDTEGYGGAPLLGVNGICFITHGASSAWGIYHSIRVACDAVQNKLNERIVAGLARIGFGRAA